MMAIFSQANNVFRTLQKVNTPAGEGNLSDSSQRFQYEENPRDCQEIPNTFWIILV
jgi:hypothetical protein